MPLPKKTQQIRNNLVYIFWTNVLQMKILNSLFKLDNTWTIGKTSVKLSF